MSFKKIKNKSSILAIAGLTSLLVLTGCTTNGADSNINNETVESSQENELNVPKTATAIGAFAIDSTGSVITADKINPDATRVELIFDLHCPACKMVEENSSKTFNELIKSGEAQFWLTPVSFMDESASTDDYSSRATSALIEVAESSPEHFWDFFQKLFQQQPYTGDSYIPAGNDRLVKIAKSVGVPEEVTDRFVEERFKLWALENTAVVEARNDVLPNGLSTPTIVIGGEFDGLELVGFEPVVFEDSDTDKTFKEVFNKVN